jgi:hypothetical protein
MTTNMPSVVSRWGQGGARSPSYFHSDGPGGELPGRTVRIADTIKRLHAVVSRRRHLAASMGAGRLDLATSFLAVGCSARNPSARLGRSIDRSGARHLIPHSSIKLLGSTNASYAQHHALPDLAW